MVGRFRFREDNESKVKRTLQAEGFDLIAAPQANTTILHNHHKCHLRATFCDTFCKDLLKPENVDRFVFFAQMAKYSYSVQVWRSTDTCVNKYSRKRKDTDSTPFS